MKIYEGLIKRNPENHAYYHGQATARHADSAEQKLELFAKAKEQYPRAQAPQRLALDVAKGRLILGACSQIWHSSSSTEEEEEAKIRSTCSQNRKNYI